MRSLLSPPVGLVVVLLALVGCTADAATPAPSTVTTNSDPNTTDVSARPPTTDDPARVYFATIPAGGELPDGATCAQLVLDDDGPAGALEVRPENAAANATIVQLDTAIDIDGADERWNAELAPRIRGDFTGTTEQILRWGACKWGFDEDLTRARAVTESSWRMSTEGDESDDPAACAMLARPVPCAQSFGLLQVKGTVHEGTYPASTSSTAFGVDYALAWLRACYEGSFTWLEDDGYVAGDELGCVGAWFSGQWWDQPANDYVGEVRFHLEARTWEGYRA